MADRAILPITGSRPGTYGKAVDAPLIGLCPMVPTPLMEIQAFSGAEEQVGKDLRRLAAVRTLPATGRFMIKENSWLAQCTPDRWLVGGALVEKLDRPDSLAADMASRVRLDHARCGIIISGPEASRGLAGCLALDMRERALPVNALAETGTHHMPLTVIRTATERFVLLIYRSYAESLWELVEEACAPHGYTMHDAEELLR